MIDIGKAFDLVVGTSTGGIVACALGRRPPEAGTDTLSVTWREIFPYQTLRSLWGLETLVRGLGMGLSRGDRALRHVLAQTFGTRTMCEIYDARHVALAITTVDMIRHAAVVFKTSHLSRLTTETTTAC